MGQGGFRAKDPRATYTVASHVEFGSGEYETQYISATSSVEVAVFFAVKGFFHFGNYNPRIAVMTVPQDFEKHSAISQIPRAYRTARNFALCFEELVYTEEDINDETTIEQCLDLDPAQLQEFEALFENRRVSFAAFRRQYITSNLSAAVTRALNTATFIATVDLVGLPHYVNQRPRNIGELRLVLENDNILDNQAVCIMARSPFEAQWFPVGHLSREHARVIRSMLEASGQRFAFVGEPNLAEKYETKIKLQFTIPSARYETLSNTLCDVCGGVNKVTSTAVEY